MVNGGQVEFVLLLVYVEVIVSYLYVTIHVTTKSSGSCGLIDSPAGFATRVKRGLG